MKSRKNKRQKAWPMMESDNFIKVDGTVVDRSGMIVGSTAGSTTTTGPTFTSTTTDWKPHYPIRATRKKVSDEFTEETIEKINKISKPGKVKTIDDLIKVASIELNYKIIEVDIEDEEKAEYTEDDLPF